MARTKKNASKPQGKAPRKQSKAKKQNVKVRYIFSIDFY